MQPIATVDSELDRLASTVREHVDLGAIAEMTGLPRLGGEQ